VNEEGWSTVAGGGMGRIGDFTALESSGTFLYDST